MKKLAWIVGGGSVAAALGLLAMMGGCTSGNGQNDGGTDSTTKDTSSDNNTNDVATEGGQDAGADCKTVPTGAPFETDAGPYCPFQASADGGTKFGACGQGFHCCDYTSGSNPSVCEPNGTACAFEAGTNADFQCNETADCPNGNVCCMSNGATLGQDLGCSYFFASKDHGTSCVQGTACPGTQLQICGQTADCPNGKTCQPLNTLAVWLGVCN